MSESTEGLRRKIDGAVDLQSVVRTMKAMAAANIGQLERSVTSLAGYMHAVELGLGASLREFRSAPGQDPKPAAALVIVFGSDQGLVGPFNDVVADRVVGLVAGMGEGTEIIAIGERAGLRIADLGLIVSMSLPVPGSIATITPLVDRIEIELETRQSRSGSVGLHVVYNHRGAGAAYEPSTRRLLPLDAQWRSEMMANAWPGSALPEALGSVRATLRALIREYLFVALFRACAESMASENASRLAAMERADRNISDLLGDLRGQSHRLRQSRIDEELFDVIAGFEALSDAAPARGAARDAAPQK